MTTETQLSEVTNCIFLLLGPGSLLCCRWPLFLSLLNYVLILLPLRLVFLLHFFIPLISKSRLQCSQFSALCAFAVQAFFPWGFQPSACFSLFPACMDSGLGVGRVLYPAVQWHLQVTVALLWLTGVIVSQ